MQNDSADTRVRVRCDDDDDREPAGDCIDRISDEEFPVFMHVVAVQCQSSAKRYGRVTRAPQSRPLPIASRRAVDETLRRRRGKGERVTSPDECQLGTPHSLSEGHESET